MASSPLRSIAQNLLLSVVSLAVTVAVLEGLARWLEPAEARPAVASYITDWAQWEDDFYTVKGDALGWPPFEDYNQDGVRDRAHALEKPPGVRRLICLGDSTTAGYKIRSEEAWPRVLQDLADAVGLRVEVFNVALGGWSTRQELIAYRRIGRKYEPDQVLVGICLNDIPELGNNLSRPPSWLTALYRLSALVRRVVDATSREIHSIEELFEHPESDRVEAAYERLFDDLRALRDEVEADGASLGVLVFPFRLQINADAPPPLPQETLAAFCAEEGIPILDLLPALRAAGTEAFVDYDHFSPLGSQVVAEQVLASGLLTPPGEEDGRPGRAEPGDASTLENLLSDLASPREAERAAAARALGDRLADAEAALPRLGELLRDEAPTVRAAAAWALGRLGPRPDEDVPLLESRLEDDDPAVRAGAAWSLGRVGNLAAPSALALVRSLGDPDPEVRRRAASALEQIRPPAAAVLDALLRVLRDPDSPGRSEAARVVAQLGAAAAEAVPALVAALGVDDLALRQQAVRALGAIGPGAALAVPTLIRALDDPELTWRAADALGSIGPAAAEAVPALRARLRDERSNVQWRAAVALGKMGPSAAPAGPDLARLATTRTPSGPVAQANVRLGAVTALSRVNAAPDLQIQTFVAALADDNPEVRTRAAHGLRRLGPAAAGAVPALEEALEDRDAWVRVAAVRALGRVGGPADGSRAALERALEDEDPLVRDHAAAALRTLAAARGGH